VTVPESELCCGSAGVYNLVEPEPAAQLGERKARNVLSVHPDALVASNAGCLLQITSALRNLDVDLPTLHPIELVDASIRGIIPPALARVGKGIARLS
jgi:glycolate oxidase iron-sulfur subunit